MGNRTAKFISTLFASIIAGAPLAAVSQNAPSATGTANAAASDCLASPKSTAPQGQHWYYRLERSTKRQCWYLRAEGGKDSGKAMTQTAQASTDTPTVDSAAPQQQRSVQDARAEYLTRRSAASPGAPAQGAAIAPVAEPPSPTANDSNAQQPAVATRWPDVSTAVAPPAPEPVAPPATAVAQQSAKPVKSAAPVTLAAADATADRSSGSLQMLLLVIGGALALAGLLGSVIYRFAGGRVRAQAGDRRVNWDNREQQDQDDSRAPWLNARPAVTPRAQQPRPIDFDAARLQTTRLAAIADEIDLVTARKPSALTAQTEPDEAGIKAFDIKAFEEAFEAKRAAPQLAANDTHDEVPADRDENARDEDAVDIDIITAMLERLAKEGPRLTQPSPEAALADLVRSQRGQSAARA